MFCIINIAAITNNNNCNWKVIFKHSDVNKVMMPEPDTYLLVKHTAMLKFLSPS